MSVDMVSGAQAYEPLEAVLAAALAFGLHRGTATDKDAIWTTCMAVRECMDVRAMQEDRVEADAMVALIDRTKSGRNSVAMVQ
jgi:hypothetical protein